MSRHGTTEKIVQQLCDRLDKSITDVVNLERDPLPDLALYDLILIGGSIHTGRIQKQVRKFCILNEPQLLKKKIGLFICSIETHETDEEFFSAFPARLRKHAIACGKFGGELLVNKMGFVERLYTRIVYGVSENLQQIDKAAIENFIDKLTVDKSKAILNR